jgi:ribonuclease BN (tRNA processing enzyme)
MDLVVLGAGPSYSDEPGGLGASYLLVEGEHALLLDMGQGVFPSLLAAWPPETLDAILISHLHPDHYIDLIPLRYFLRYEFTPSRRMRVLGPAALGERLDLLHAEPGWTAATLDPEAVGGASEREIGPFQVQAGLVTHTAESYAYRVSAGTGPALVYSGDCGRASDLAALVRPGDVVLSEASFGPRPVPPEAMHLNGALVGELAAGRGASRVLLTHIQMPHDRPATIEAVHRRFDGPVQFVRPGDRLAL